MTVVTDATFDPALRFSGKPHGVIEVIMGNHATQCRHLILTESIAMFLANGVKDGTGHDWFFFQRIDAAQDCIDLPQKSVV